MKPERAFIAERAAAQHCRELLRDGPAPDELLPLFARMGDRLAKALALHLAPLTGGAEPLVKSSEARIAALAEAGIAPLAANCLIGLGAERAPLLLSIEAAAVFRLIDRAFGGRGAVPSPLPGAFPLSADLMIARLEAALLRAMGAALGRLALTPLARGGDLDAMAPFAEGTALALLMLDIAEPDGAAWKVHLIAPLATLALLGTSGGPGGPSRSGPASPLAPPFADVPLPLRAVLVDMRLPVSALGDLAPGKVLPVAVARAVPLWLGDRPVALGTVGAMDDRIAVQVTQAF